MDNIREKVVKCFANLGMIVNEEDNFAILDYLVDSVQYISFILELEDAFDIAIPDEFLLKGNMNTVDDVCNVVLELL